MLLILIILINYILQATDWNQQHRMLFVIYFKVCLIYKQKNIRAVLLRSTRLIRAVIRLKQTS